MARDKIKEIQQLKGRNEFETFWDGERKFRQLDISIQGIETLNNISKQELYKYIPVTLIATLESFFRSAVKRMIDVDDKYFINSHELFKNNNIKIDFEILQNIHKREFTLGELISHHVSFSKFENIDETFSRLLEISFTGELKKFVSLSLYPGRELTSKEFITNYSIIISDVKRLFAIRNIICHEMAKDINLKKEDVFQLYKSTKLFLNQAHNYISDLLYPDSEEKQLERVGLIEGQIKKAEIELTNFIETIKKRPVNYLGSNIDLNLFLKSFEHWLLYRDEFLDSIYADLKDDDIDKIDYLIEKRDLIIFKLDDLKMAFDNEYFD